MLITVEGVDGTGKSTLAKSLHEELGGELTKEPGTPGFSPMDIEKHMNTVRFFVWMAYALGQDEDTPAQRSLLAALYQLHHPGVEDDLRAWLLDAGRKPRALKRVESAHEDLSLVLEKEPTLAERLHKYGRRGCIRHALMHASDSGENTATLAGLLFFANHHIHAELANGMSYRVFNPIISDRYSHSQLAYGPAFGCDRIVEALYDQYGDTEPDHTLLLTADLSELERRITGRSGEKQRGKSWAKRGVFEAAQNNYLEMATDNWIIIDTTSLSEEAVYRKALEGLSEAPRSVSILDHKPADYA